MTGLGVSVQVAVKFTGSPLSITPKHGLGADPATLRARVVA